MTMPHLENCRHSEDGWCLDCVKKLWVEGDRKLSKRQHALEVVASAVRWTSNILVEVLSHHGPHLPAENYEQLKNLAEAAQQCSAGKWKGDKKPTRTIPGWYLYLKGVDDRIRYAIGSTPEGKVVLQQPSGKFIEVEPSYLENQYIFCPECTGWDWLPTKKAKKVKT